MMSQSLQSLLFVALPYAAIAVFIAGVLWRYRKPFTISSLSSQMIESRWLAWGTIPFHVGIFILIVGHLLPVLIPGAWHTMLSNRAALLVIEGIGIAAAVLTIIGLGVLLLRRGLTSSVRGRTTVVDWIVLVLLLAQAGLGLEVALTQRWGAIWSTTTTTPYLWSLLTLRPDPAFVNGLPLPMVLHLSGAWLLLALLPFSRLIHMFAVPLGYLGRPFQKVVWFRASRGGDAGRAA
jgi:nitrate reductase gamma subunit